MQNIELPFSELKNVLYDLESLKNLLERYIKPDTGVINIKTDNILKNELALHVQYLPGNYPYIRIFIKSTQIISFSYRINEITSDKYIRTIQDSLMTIRDDLYSDYEKICDLIISPLSKKPNDNF